MASEDKTTSLAARRARLRGSLAKPALPPDPYSDPANLPSNPSSTLEEGVPTAPRAMPVPPNAELEVASQSPALPKVPLATDELAAEDAPIVKDQSHIQKVLAGDIQENSNGGATNKLSNEIFAAALDEPSEPEVIHITPVVRGQKHPTSEQPSKPVTEKPVGGSYQTQSFSADDTVPNTPGAMELIRNIDETMTACATNLSALYRATVDQKEDYKQLCNILEKQTFSELSLNLAGLIDSLSSMLEPMKAAAELIKTLNQNTVAQSQSAGERNKLSVDDLVTNLAQQLVSGHIDPWTFKCAYMAVYPADNPSDLLHRLVDLLGTQKLSGDLFRAAYEAVQAAAPPSAGISSRIDSKAYEGGAVQTNDADMHQLKDLQAAHKELEAKGKGREEELMQLLAKKEKQLEEAKSQVETKYEELKTEFVNRDQALFALEEELKQRSFEISQKDSQNQQLKAQLDELTENTKELMSKLQKPSIETPSTPSEPTPPKSSPGFFDVAPTSNFVGSMFDSQASVPLFNQEMEQLINVPTAQTAEITSSSSQIPAVPTAPQSQDQSGSFARTTLTGQPTDPGVVKEKTTIENELPPNTVTSQGPITQVNTSPLPKVAPQQQAVPRSQQTTPYVAAAGSYGSGVRAQVFEVIVRQALAGAPWKEMCAGPMQVNNISPQEVEEEVKRREALLKK